jgi:predicted nucleic acid-binding protein
VKIIADAGPLLHLFWVEASAWALPLQAIDVVQEVWAEVLVLCDELVARDACTALLLPVVGSIGLILDAFRLGRVPHQTAVAALQDLPRRGRLHVRRQLIELAVEHLAASN